MATDLIHYITSHEDFLNILLLLGIALFGGTIGGTFLTKIRFPSVVGYVVIGIILGRTGLGLIDKGVLTDLRPFNYLALGLIGFMIGGELKKDFLLKYGKQFLNILMFEGLTAFVTVSILVATVSFILTGELSTSIALALLLGSIASATAPAATTDVLWENKTRGPITSTVFGIVALDDALALILFAFSASLSKILNGSESSGFLISILQPVYEMTSAVVIGCIAGLILNFLFKSNIEKEKTLVFSLGLIILTLGLALTFKADMLLASMACGVIVANSKVKESQEIFDIIGRYTPPIFTLFFVLVGANLCVSNMTFLTIVLALVYLLSRTVGKMLGATIGARLGDAPVSVQKYLPFCLFSQAGVAIGLSILAEQKFSGTLGNSMVIIVTATTFIVQLIGPPFVKYAVTKGNEIGLSVSEEDLLRKNSINDILSKDIPIIYESTPIAQILNIFSTSNYLYFPVVTKAKKVLGIITIDNLKNSFLAFELTDLLLAHDLMEPIEKFYNKALLLSNANEELSHHNCDYLVVVDQQNKLEGILEKKDIQKFISRKITELHCKAENLFKTRKANA